MSKCLISAVLIAVVAAWFAPRASSAAQIPAELCRPEATAAQTAVPDASLDAVELAELRHSDPTQQGGDVLVTIVVIVAVVAIFYLYFQHQEHMNSP